MNLKNKYWLFISVFVVMISLVACGSDESDETIVFAAPEWQSIDFHNAVAQIIAEEGYGYKTDLLPGSSPATLQGLRNGEIDVYMETWIENFKDQYEAGIEEGDIVELSTNFDDNDQGLYVPTYMIEGDEERGIEPMAPDLQSVADLEEYWELFEDPEHPDLGRIYGALPGWEADNIMKEMYEAYGLDETYNYFQPGSEAALNTSLIRAYDNGDPWVGYNWEPTWIIGLYDMTLLEDEKEFFVSQPVTVSVHESFMDRAPDLVEFLEQYETSSEITSEALGYMEENDADEWEAAEWFLTEYEELWTEWVPEGVAEAVKAAL